MHAKQETIFKSNVREFDAVEGESKAPTREFKSYDGEFKANVRESNAIEGESKAPTCEFNVDERESKANVRESTAIEGESEAPTCEFKSDDGSVVAFALMAVWVLMFCETTWRR